MVDLSLTIEPRSDQLNADDLIGRTLTITVTGVSRCTEPDQPIAISFEGDNRKPYKPCKSMRRVLVKIWGPDGASYVGRRLTLYRDDGVMFGGVAVGGIRISHMSHIDKDTTMALTATRANRKPFTVRPLKEAAPKQEEKKKGRSAAEVLDELGRELAAAQTENAVLAILDRDNVKGVRQHLKNGHLDRYDRMVADARARFALAENDESVEFADAEPEQMET